jgi:hypothetical protein
MRRTLARTFILAIVATVAYAFNENGESDGKPSTIETTPPDPQGGGAESARNNKKLLYFPENNHPATAQRCPPRDLTTHKPPIEGGS